RGSASEPRIGIAGQREDHGTDGPDRRRHVERQRWRELPEQPTGDLRGDHDHMTGTSPTIFFLDYQAREHHTGG
ncbi:MAG TPA: hypothetical protein VF921_13355, partial [Vicinamibacterales bacterium]